MHIKAIKETGNNLIAALDKHDSVCVLDSFFTDVYFFTEFERFDRHLEKLKREGIVLDFLVLCTPNYLHDAHIRYGLNLGANVICEKPIVLNPWNVDALALIEEETNKKAFNILQLRLHPAIQELKKKVDAGSKKENIKSTCKTSPVVVTSTIIAGKEILKKAEVLPPILGYIFLICFCGYSDQLKKAS